MLTEKIDPPQTEPMEPPLDLLPPLHSPGRSKTISAWSALIALLLLIGLGFFYSFLLKESIRALLWASQPFTGVTIQAEILKVKLGEPLRWKNIVITSGPSPHESRLELQTLSLELTSPWRMVFGDHVVINKLEASAGKGLLDLRHEASPAPSSFLQQQTHHFHEMLQQKITELPSSIILRDISLFCITENQRYNIDHFSCFLPKKEPGKLSYESMLLEAGTIRCHLSQTSCDASWDGKTIIIKNLSLAEGIRFHHLQLTPYSDRLELGFAATVFHGLLRADACLRKNGCGPTLEGAMLGQQLPMESLSKFLGLQKKILGTLREGRLIFRGSPLHPIDAEASLRMLVDHFRLEKKEWASLSIASNLIGRKISVTDFQLKQQENRLNIVGEMSLPEEWHKIGQAPFHLKLNASIADASQLIDLIGAPRNDVTGKIFMDGEVTGAANRAEGYLHMQGTEMTLHELPIDAIESTLLFQGEKTALSNLDLWNGNNHVQLSGSMANSWPHQYEAQGTINCHNFFEKWKPLAELVNHDDVLNEETNAETSSKQREERERVNPCLGLVELCNRLPFLKNIRGGLLQAQWNGHGTATTHEGSFEFRLKEAIQENHSLHIHCTGSYLPDLLTCPILKIESGTKAFSTSLSLSSHAINLNNLTFHENKRCTLSGALSLPLDGMGLLHNNALPSLFQWNAPLEVNVTLHHFSLQEMTPFVSSLKWDAWVDGKIQASGLWSEPSIDMALHGEEIILPSKNNTPFHLQLHSKKGHGFIDASLRAEDNKWMRLQGTLPLGLTRLEEAAPLKTKDQLSLAPDQAPFHLTLTLPESRMDFLAEALLPSNLTLHHGTIAGEVFLHGTVAQPELSGHLALKAEQCSFHPFLQPLQALQAKVLLSKNKITLENFSALLGKGKLEASGSSIGRLGQLQHEYHFTGHDLLFYQQEHTAIKGAASLSLQGDAQGGKLTGKLNISELDWKPQLTIVPFLLPPGIILNPSLPSSTTAPSWTSDLTLEYQPNKTTSPSSLSDHKNSYLEKFSLHLLGPLFAPAPEGTVEFSQLPIQSPQGPMRFLQGGMNFHATQPWVPHFQLSAEITINQNKIIAHLADTSESPSLFFESPQLPSQETAALLLAKPTDLFSSTLLSTGWMAELPFWIRQQEITEPTSIPEPASPLLTDPKLHEGLGFTGSGISYHFELK